MDHPVAPDMPWISHCSLPHAPVESHIVLGFVPIDSPETAHRPHAIFAVDYLTHVVLGAGKTRT
jgi:hypothetical protein